MGKFLDSLDKKLKIIDRSNYYREQYQSFMTAPEWRNVEIAEEYAQFVSEGNSIFHYPYFGQTWDLWKITYNTYVTARKYDSFWSVMTSEYMLMDLFISVFTTLELIPKGFLSLLLYPFIAAQNETEMQTHLATFYQEYAQNLQTIPFYEHKYAEIRADLAEKYRNCEHKSWGDWFSWTCISLELFARQWISKPLIYWYQQDDNIVSASTEVLVKYTKEDCLDQEQTKEEFKQKIDELAGQNLAVHLVGEDLYAKESTEGKTYSSVYARLSVPRYDAFKEVLAGFHHEGIQLKKIAGQDRVQIKCDINATDESALEATHDALNNTVGHHSEYSYGDRIHSHRRLCLFDVPVRDLAEKTMTLNDIEHAQVKFIHNF